MMDYNEHVMVDDDESSNRSDLVRNNITTSRTEIKNFQDAWTSFSHHGCDSDCLPLNSVKDKMFSESLATDRNIADDNFSLSRVQETSNEMLLFNSNNPAVSTSTCDSSYDLCSAMDVGSLHSDVSHISDQINLNENKIDQDNEGNVQSSSPTGLNQLSPESLDFPLLKTNPLKAMSGDNTSCVLSHSQPAHMIPSVNVMSSLPDTSPRFDLQPQYHFNPNFNLSSCNNSVAVGTLTFFLIFVVYRVYVRLHIFKSFF